MLNKRDWNDPAVFRQLGWKVASMLMPIVDRNKLRAELALVLSESDLHNFDVFAKHDFDPLPTLLELSERGLKELIHAQFMKLSSTIAQTVIKMFDQLEFVPALDADGNLFGQLPFLRYQITHPQQATHPGYAIVRTTLNKETFWDENITLEEDRLFNRTYVLKKVDGQWQEAADEHAKRLALTAALFFPNTFDGG